VLTLLVQEAEGVVGLASTAVEEQRSAGLFMEWAVGKVGEIFPPDAGKLMLRGAKIRWEVQNNQVELGIYFYPRDYVPHNRTVLQFLNASGRSGLDIPPGKVAVT